jgi:hypothetical protein
MSTEKHETDYRAFIGATDSELGYGLEAVSTELHDYISPSGQRVGVSVSKPTGGYEATVLMPQPHDYRNEPLSIRRAEIMASKLNARIALLETPGTVGLLEPDNTPQGYHVYTETTPLKGAQQTLRQLRGAVNGDFSEHAAVQLDAATDTLSLNSSDQLMLFGESMGVVTATDMIRHIGERGLSLSTVMLHEVVNASGSHGLGRLISLLSNLGSVENDRRDGYLAENDAIGHPMLAFEQMSDSNKRLDTERKKFTQQGIASLANGLGMRVGIEPRLVSAISRFGKSATPEILLTKGAQSTVSHADEYSRLQGELSNTTGHLAPVWEHVDPSGENLPIGHSFLMSFGRQAMYAGQLRGFISDSER